MNRICVFCGSSAGSHPEYRQAASDLARVLTARGIGLVYGGASLGTMGVLARTVLEANGEVIGVIPAALARREVAFEELPALRVVDSMHERKALMVELADGFIALPGGLGTLDELCEVLTWGQLGMHSKPCGLLNVRGYFDELLRFLDTAAEEEFILPVHRSMILVGEEPEGLLDRFDAYRAPVVDKARWIRGLDNP